MTTDSPGRTAMIYQFPVRAVARSGAEQIKPVVEVSPGPYAAAALGSGWYHEAAIQEAERTAKR